MSFQSVRDEKIDDDTKKRVLKSPAPPLATQHKQQITDTTSNIYLSSDPTLDCSEINGQRQPTTVDVVYCITSESTSTRIDGHLPVKGNSSHETYSASNGLSNLEKGTKTSMQMDPTLDGKSTQDILVNNLDHDSDGAVVPKIGNVPESMSQLDTMVVEKEQDKLCLEDVCEPIDLQQVIFKDENHQQEQASFCNTMNGHHGTEPSQEQTPSSCKNDNDDAPNYEQHKKLIEARRRLFHSHAHAIDCEPCESNFTSILAKFPTPPEQSFVGGFDSSRQQDETKVQQWQNINNISSLLLQLENQSKPNCNTISNQRPGFTSLSLEEVAQSTLHPTNRESISNSTGRKTAIGMKSFALKFNSVSVACVAKWVSSQVSTKKRASSFAVAGAKDEKNTAKRRAHSTNSCLQNAKFRICAICHKLGHYELECPEQTLRQNKMFLSFMPLAVDRQPPIGENFISTLDGVSVDQPSRPSAGGRTEPTVDNENVVLLELCGGFLVEQKAKPLWQYRKKPESVKLDESCEDLTEIDGFTIRARKKGPPSSVDPISRWNLGDLCVWFPHRPVKKIGAVHVGTVTSTPFRYDGVLSVRIRCIAVISPESNDDNNNNSNRDDRIIGETFVIQMADLFSIQDVLAMPSAEKSKNGVSSREIVSSPAAVAKSASKSKSSGRAKVQTVVQRQKTAKHNRPTKKSPSK